MFFFSKQINEHTSKQQLSSVLNEFTYSIINFSNTILRPLEWFRPTAFKFQSLLKLLLILHRTNQQITILSQ